MSAEIQSVVGYPPVSALSAGAKAGKTFVISPSAILANGPTDDNFISGNTESSELVLPVTVDGSPSN